MRENNNPSNLTEKQWSFIESIIEPNTKRKRKHDLRDIFNAILYVVKSGCQWRMLPSDFAPWNTVYFYYRKWKLEGVIEQIHEYLRELVRKKPVDTKAHLLALLILVALKHHVKVLKTAGMTVARKSKGENSTLIVDSLGLLLAVVVHSATPHDSHAAFMVIEGLKNRFCRLKTIIADGGYRGELIQNVEKSFGWILKVVLRSDSTKNFQVLPKRWIVERTFAWFEGFRRLSKDYEVLTENSEHMIMLAMIKIMSNRISE